MKCFQNVTEAIGNTPLVSLSRFTSHYGVKGKLFAKLEHLNPGLSKKDRVARRMLVEAKQEGRLLPGQPVIELTSGNTGIGLSICCANLGHPFYAVMSKGNSVERSRMMKALGAHVVLVDQSLDSQPGFVSQADLLRVEEEAVKLVTRLGGFRADQFNLMANENAHYLETGPEVWQTGLRPRAFVDFAGTGGTFSGVSRFLKERDSTIACHWVEPHQPGHQIQGGGYFTSPTGSGLHFQLLAQSRGHIDSVIKVSDADAIMAARKLAELEGLLGGFSSGANAYAAIQILKQHQDPDYSVVFLVCDSGLKYFSLPTLYEA